LKTTQFGDRKVCIPIPEIPGNKISPVLALRTLFCAKKCIPKFPAFSFGPFQWIHYTELLKGVKILGKDPTHFGCHSLWRGGASFTAAAGVPAYFIKLQGDWSSEEVF
jgi:hypothetical protein